MSYWAERTAKAQQAITDKNIREIEKQLTKYYRTTAKKVTSEFEKVYNAYIQTIGEGKTPAPAKLYSMEKYWHMQAQIRQELERLGEKEIALYTKYFEINYFEVYYSLNIEGLPAFNTIEKAAVQEVLKQIWAVDGLSFSQRIWNNMGALQQALSDGLVTVITTGTGAAELTRELMAQQAERIGKGLEELTQAEIAKAYRNADKLVRTELAHIQTQAAQKRYDDYGIEELEIFVDEDERTCPICSKMEGKRYPIGAKMPVPVHPNCRCCMIPVIK